MIKMVARIEITKSKTTYQDTETGNLTTTVSRSQTFWDNGKVVRVKATRVEETLYPLR
jgi:hypothetical protein